MANVAIHMPSKVLRSRSDTDHTVELVYNGAGQPLHVTVKFNSAEYDGAPVVSFKICPHDQNNLLDCYTHPFAPHYEFERQPLTDEDFNYA